MYTLTDDERKLFIATYFSCWGDDINKVSVNEYSNLNEYLINDYYLFRIKK